ncbi:uncharacterized protein LOC129948510 [Eupeodes corollae]|uniref:uncharacterized protein LOC129948510 n=1 Tax=Eupeodes corollae TaxID=290404 RepID=UPI002492D359|nr:uncharacterized protein LOC129948510 [Eupeodes corollae]
MPKKSEKENIIVYLLENASDKIMLIESDAESENEDGVDEILVELYEELLLVLAVCRRLTITVPKSIDWRENILSTLDSDRFRQMLRMERHQFDLLLSLISDDEEFQKPHACKQFSIGLQLAIVLYRLGSSGENASDRKIATTLELEMEVH